MTTEATSDNPTTTPSAPDSSFRFHDFLLALAVLAFVVAMLWVVGTKVQGALKAHTTGIEEHERLIAASTTSDAHQFLVYHWTKCNGLSQTQASCYAAIRSAAAPRGEEFVRRVDAAAIELGLI